MQTAQTETTDPPWAKGDIPKAEEYLSSECFVAGAISTLEPFRHFHPAWCLPVARQALDALSEWSPDEPEFECNEVTLLVDDKVLFRKTENT